MSLLNFFTQQRNHWRSQSANKPIDYVAGGLVALNQAEVAFKATTLYNVQQQAAVTQDELERVSYELTQARRKIASIEANLTAMTQDETELPEWQQSRARSTRKALRKIVAVANYLAMSPEKKIGKILELGNGLMTAYKEEVEEGESKSNTQTDSPAADNQSM